MYECECVFVCLTWYRLRQGWGYGKDERQQCRQITYFTHQIPLFLKQGIGKYEMRGDIAVLESRRMLSSSTSSTNSHQRRR